MTGNSGEDNRAGAPATASVPACGRGDASAAMIRTKEFAQDDKRKTTDKGQHTPMTDELQLKRYIRTIPDFPQPGIAFRDITPMLAHPQTFRAVIDRFAGHFRDRGVTAVIAAEARGFIFAAPLALQLDAAFIPVRKPGKLPFETHSFHYELEYGSDSLEMHTDAVTDKDTVLLVDDLLATGGTMEACVRMTENANAKIAGLAFVIELDDLQGRDRLKPYDVFSLVHYTEDE